ncbi:MAG: 50S ribosomal protein L22 [Candidatus Cloacimonetes bacterium]|jgi:large subunit ribosomal protein L22|nr:50S ribosomal protein L22 [Candidatus Cloacimonadota bacterium]MBT6993560.1 50S ribosomal protein L22 [Candidatus Cloacimonadota bacterium]MBT7470298.1 50S ribosomal protein L22 [Candidatus Cloacimonadota bacterium]
MEAVAKVKNLRGSARKARLVLDLIRGKDVPSAQRILLFSKKSVAPKIAKLLNSAIANATMKEGKTDIENMIVNEVYADDGPIMKRQRPRAQGRATVIRRRTCHITLRIKDIQEESNGSEN